MKKSIAFYTVLICAVAGITYLIAESGHQVLAGSFFVVGGGGICYDIYRGMTKPKEPKEEAEV